MPTFGEGFLFSRSFSFLIVGNVGVAEVSFDVGNVGNVGSVGSVGKEAPLAGFPIRLQLSLDGHVFLHGSQKPCVYTLRDMKRVVVFSLVNDVRTCQRIRQNMSEHVWTCHSPLMLNFRYC